MTTHPINADGPQTSNPRRAGVVTGPADQISAQQVHDPDLGVSYPARAVIWIDSIHRFTANGPADWRAVLARAGMTGGTVIIPDNGIPGGAWRQADLRMARLIRCPCGHANLDPDNEAFNLTLCADCYEEAGWENTHTDKNHHRHPDPDCPLCAEHEPT